MIENTINLIDEWLENLPDNSSMYFEFIGRENTVCDFRIDNYFIIISVEISGYYVYILESDVNIFFVRNSKEYINKHTLYSKNFSNLKDIFLLLNLFIKVRKDYVRLSELILLNILGNKIHNYTKIAIQRYKNIDNSYKSKYSSDWINIFVDLGRSDICLSFCILKDKIGVVYIENYNEKDYFSPPEPNYYSDKITDIAKYIDSIAIRLAVK